MLALLGYREKGRGKNVTIITIYHLMPREPRLNVAQQNYLMIF